MSFASVQDAHDTLKAVLEAASAALPDADGFRVVGELADDIDPPAALLAPPQLTWDGPGAEPTDATWVVVLVVPASDRSMAELYRLLPFVSEAIDEKTDFVMRTAEPGVWQTGNTGALPCYSLTVEVAL